MYRNPKPTVDVIVWDGTGIILIQRGREPFRGKWALPGGFVDFGEPAEAAAIREVKEETGLNIIPRAILGVYSAPERDPRTHTMSTVFIAESTGETPTGGDDAAAAKWVRLEDVVPNELAFDHGIIFEDFKKWLKKGATYWSTLDR
ncbi:MAG: NUDIX hydrolase [Candidatus Thorarchaeota archaeon]|nr:NUDIX hydrolase [Candidatus Thorarchaeota archaeon]